MKKQKSSLTTVVLVVVAIPIIFQIAAVFVLIQMQRSAEAETAQAVHAREVSDLSNQILRDMYLLWAIMDASTSEMNAPVAFYIKQVEPIMQRIRDRYAALDRISGDNVHLQHGISEARKAMSEAESLISSALEALRHHRYAEIRETYEARRLRLRALFRSLVTEEFLLVAQHERDFAAISDARQTEIRRKMNGVVIAVCVLNSIFCIIIAVLLVRNITARLAILSENTRRLANNMELKPAIRGNDEIAALDRTFHQMADDLLESARARQEMINMITHDLRSPLTTIRGVIEVFQAGRAEPGDERGQKMMEMADRNGQLMMSLIDDLLDIEKIKSGMMTVALDQVCLAEVFEAIKVSLESWATSGGVTLKVQDTDLFAKADEKKLERVLFNLISNSLKFSREGTTITLSAQEVEGKQVKISVADQGSGIPADKIALIFDRFQQAGNHAGSGLGLAICKAIVQLHGGKIWADSEEGKGSTFSFTLLQA